MEEIAELAKTASAANACWEVSSWEWSGSGPELSCLMSYVL